MRTTVHHIDITIYDFCALQVLVLCFACVLPLVLTGTAMHTSCDSHEHANLTLILLMWRIW